MSKQTIATAETSVDRMFRPRRRFLARALGLGVGAAGLAGTGRVATAKVGAVNDPAILNFALNLEYLEAEYYTFALTGMSIEALGIPTTGSGTPGPITIKPNPQVPFRIPVVQQYAVEIASDEQKHVDYLRTTLAALGVQPVGRPAIDLLNSFNILAMAAGLGNSFDPFANDINFMIGAYIFEDVGVSAYHGAAPLIKDKDILAAAAGVLGIEAYHAGLIRTFLLAQMQGPATQAISNVRLALGGAVDYGVASGPNGNSSIVVADSNALAASRSTREVLNIVYGAPNAMGGLFFPNGVNGSIH
jgi:hypothetical protein